MPRHSEATLSAIKQAVDIVALVGQYLTLHPSGSKFKALCPFHDDHNPSLEVNPERQSFKCWVCNAGGDVFDFVKGIQRCDFPEALQLLADRAGIVLESPTSGPARKGPSKSDLMAVNAWAEQTFAEALALSPETREYVEQRGINPQSVERFRLGYAPDVRDWLLGRARKAGFGAEALEQAGLVVRSANTPGLTRERFRGRLIFPIRDLGGRVLGFGGRILPQVERALADAGKNVAKYLNSPETPLFQKRRILYGSDLARAAAREAGWVAVVEGYTDVIAAHQVGLANVVGTLGTALGDEHVAALRRLAGRVVLIFDGDEAGQRAADRSLELFLGHEVDVRVLTLPSKLDPCDFLLEQGAEPFRALVDRAVDPMGFALERADARFDIQSIEGARLAAEWVLSILARIPATSRVGLDIKVARALDVLSRRVRVPVETLSRRLDQLRRTSARKPRPAAAASAAVEAAPAAPAAEGASPAASNASYRLSDLDATDRELLQIILNQPNVAGRLNSRVAVASLRDEPLRTILQACYDLHAEGSPPTFERVALRLEDPAIRALAAALLLPIDPAPMAESTRPAPWEDRLAGVLLGIARRDWHDRLLDLQEALKETDPAANPEEYHALQRELYRHYSMRPDTKTKTAS